MPHSLKSDFIKCQFWRPQNNNTIIVMRIIISQRGLREPPSLPPSLPLLVLTTPLRQARANMVMNASLNMIDVYTILFFYLA